MSDVLQKFVQLIQNDPCLYNNTLQEYSRKDLTDKAWIAISKEMQWTVADCKEKWKNIRNGFVRSIKQSSSCSSSKGKKPYYLHETMQFLMPYIRPFQNLELTGTGNISLSDTEITTQPDETEFQCQSTGSGFERNTEEDGHNSELSAKRKRIPENSSHLIEKKKKKKHIKLIKDVNKAVLENVNKNTDTQPNDYRQMFLLSLLLDVENLSERNLRQFKIKTLILLEQLITEQEQVKGEYYDTSQIGQYATNYDLDLQHDADALRYSNESCAIKNQTPSPIDVKPNVSELE